MNCTLLQNTYFTYVDNENDIVTVSNDIELKEALNVATQYFNNHICLKLHQPPKQSSNDPATYYINRVRRKLKQPKKPKRVACKIIDENEELTTQTDTQRAFDRINYLKSALNRNRLKTNRINQTKPKFI